jgi:hypothetical protein
MLIFDVRFVDFRTVVTAAASLVLNRVFGGNGIAESEDESEPELDDRFVDEFVPRHFAGGTSAWLGPVTGYSTGMETESFPTSMKTRSETPTLDVCGTKVSPKLPADLRPPSA